MKRRVTSGLVALGAALAVGAGLSPSPAPAVGHCVGAEEAVVHASGEDGGPPRFTPAFYRRLLVLEVSLDGADTASVRVRLLPPSAWHRDEDGNRVPTFRTGRIEITD